MVYREVCTEGSETAKVCTDEQKVHRRLINGDKCPQQHEVRRVQNRFLVDVPGIGGRKELLPGEVFAITSWLSKEVSRSHSTWGNELRIGTAQVSQTRKDRTQNGS